MSRTEALQGVDGDTRPASLSSRTSPTPARAGEGRTSCIYAVSILYRLEVPQPDAGITRAHEKIAIDFEMGQMASTPQSRFD
jgi:hypothetical protein